MEWFRLHAKILNDARVQTLPPEAFRLYINLLCHACQKDAGGDLGNVSETAFALRETESTVSKMFQHLIARGLIGTENETFHIPQWRKKQYKSDTSTDRVKRFRKRCKTVSETAPETEQSRAETEKKEKKEKEGARDAPRVDPSTEVSRETISRRPTRIPSDWSPSEELLAWAVSEENLTESEARREADRFRDHWIAESGAKSVKHDWNRAFRNWVRRGKDFARASGANGQAGRSYGGHADPVAVGKRLLRELEDPPEISPDQRLLRSA